MTLPGKFKEVGEDVKALARAVVDLEKHILELDTTKDNTKAELSLTVDRLQDTLLSLQKVYDRLEIAAYIEYPLKRVK